ncbi:DUF134 domain-containing protein [Candidatus Woesearchaeota archaeon]|nr:DUF134 domain-containing protein [Candidatus Woesearchaeota archaeon]
MVRPKKIKTVGFRPGVTYFKPRAVPLNEVQEVELTIDELETMRLVNIENLAQEEAAKKMGVHQSTFQRILTRAREKITDALVNGKAIKIFGGDYTMPGGDGTGPAGKGLGAGRGAGRGRMGGPVAAGPGGLCICPKCGYEQAHARGAPCTQIKCPKCGSMMARG